jgi:opacity protein-like surface antigen
MKKKALLVALAAAALAAPAAQADAFRHGDVMRPHDVSGKADVMRSHDAYGKRDAYDATESLRQPRGEKWSIGVRHPRAILHGSNRADVS